MTRIVVAFPPSELIAELDRSSFPDIVRLEADALPSAPYRGREESPREADGSHATALRPRVGRHDARDNAHAG